MGHSIHTCTNQWLWLQDYVSLINSKRQASGQAPIELSKVVHMEQKRDGGTARSVTHINRRRRREQGEEGGSRSRRRSRRRRRRELLFLAVCLFPHNPHPLFLPPHLPPPPVCSILAELDVVKDGRTQRISRYLVKQSSGKLCDANNFQWRKQAMVHIIIPVRVACSCSFDACVCVCACAGVLLCQRRSRSLMPIMLSGGGAVVYVCLFVSMSVCVRVCRC